MHERDGTAYSPHTHLAHRQSPTPHSSRQEGFRNVLNTVYIQYLHTHTHTHWAHWAFQHVVRQRDELKLTLEWAASGWNELIGQLSWRFDITVQLLQQAELQ